MDRSPVGAELSPRMRKAGDTCPHSLHPESPPPISCWRPGELRQVGGPQVGKVGGREARPQLLDRQVVSSREPWRPVTSFEQRKAISVPDCCGVRGRLRGHLARQADRQGSPGGTHTTAGLSTLRASLRPQPYHPPFSLHPRPGDPASHRGFLASRLCDPG